MIFNKLFLIACCTLIVSQAHSFTELSQMQKKAAIFLLEKQSISKKSNLLALKAWSAGSCKPNNSLNQECVNYVQPTWPTQEEKLQIVRTCKGDIDMACVKNIVPTWPTFEEKIEAVKACHDDVNMECVNYLMPTWPTFEEKIEVTQACRNSDLACIKQLMPTWPTYADKVEAAKACGED